MDLPAEVEEFLTGRDETVRASVNKTRALVLSTVPGLIEQVDWPADMLAYGLAKTYKDMVCVIMIQKGYINLGFPRGAEMNDPQGILEGTGKKARHVKIRKPEEADNPALAALLEQSARMISPPAI